MSRDRDSIACGTLADEATDRRAERDDPALLHFLSRPERAAYEAVQFYLRREPRATELRACRELDVDFELYLAAKAKAVAGPSEWRKCSSADLIRPGHPLLHGARKAPKPGAHGAGRRPAERMRLSSDELREKQEAAIETVRAYLADHPGARVADACLATGVTTRLYHTAIKRRRMRRLKDEGEAS